MALIVIGAGLVWAGGWLLVDGGVRILGRTSLTPGFLGAALLGALAALGEVALDVVPSRQHIRRLTAEHLFGSAVALPSAVLGLGALIRPLSVDSAAASAYLAAAALYTVASSVLLARGRAGKVTGVTVLAVYLAWLLVSTRI